ncbi:hypothetical protein RRV45_01635 [Bacillus sp. DTU_2020_1000418_1_SI_GHA_SEK_038]|uniref:hypothetical protein n=1 Tax=Bacillus sp. DTU_2020_1000418_1_SI_GHA_SEK_038 TaxID=3077585 RepID=UPI0028E88647|nr:hypothetical protein [Bacillus sp. DTU_2020_1000418_1_SI_GHA_SEK_038]WNS75778.1 hypothetical protein RRV45_01635 [Bacillus sp. DTU_2020_1000418_1_SI_GHA_SEK_038]
MKNLILAIGSVVLFAFSFSVVQAEEVKPTIEKANVEIEIQDGDFAVVEHIKLLNPSSIADGKIEHSFAKIHDLKPENVEITSADHQVLKAEIQEGETLDRVFIPVPNNFTDSFEYTIKYTVSKSDDFKLPLFVPLLPGESNENNVTISFQAPEGTFVQKNSFPIVKEAKNHVENKLSNLPSHVNYVYSTNPTIFHSYNIISAITIIVFFIILGVWARVEKNNAKRRMA